MKTKIVVFNQYGARVYTNPDLASLGSQLYAVNPDLEEVRDLSPHQWDLEEGKVVAASATKVAHREVLIAEKPVPKSAIRGPVAEVATKVEVPITSGSLPVSTPWLWRTVFLAVNIGLIILIERLLHL